jgi:hypothetical protein
VIAHVGGFPVEEMVPALAGVGASLAFARVWLVHHLRKR